tara:strand:- start:1075 stop:1278 length:204 start_codon:yes stop_codon:yes gene_type:complete
MEQGAPEPGVTPQDWQEWIKGMMERFPQEGQMLIDGIVSSRIVTENRIQLEQIEQKATEKKNAKGRG